MVFMPLLAILLFAFLDRFWGGPVAFKGKKAAMLAAAVGGGAVIAGGTGALFGLVWFIWRSLPFKGGSAAPQTNGERLATVVRHAPVALAAMLIASWRGLPVIEAGLWFAGFAAAASCLAFAYGQAVIDAKRAGEAIGSQNVTIEIIRGAAYGAALAATVL